MLLVYMCANFKSETETNKCRESETDMVKCNESETEIVLKSKENETVLNIL